ncbi:MAG: hypothetical protein LBP75_07660, partial [Planctomycetota bacterium]|nr:hypothetical protein [Planctomycetota bacterium]
MKSFKSLRRQRATARGWKLLSAVALTAGMMFAAPVHAASIQDVLEGAVNNVNNTIFMDTDVQSTTTTLTNAVTGLVNDAVTGAATDAAAMVLALGYTNEAAFDLANGTGSATVLFTTLTTGTQDEIDAAKAALAAAIVKGEMVADETAGNVKSGIESKIDAVNDAIA